MWKIISSALTVTVISLASPVALADRMPEDPKDATHVVSGVVQSVFTRETPDQIQYIVEIKIIDVERPASVKPGDLLSVYCFQAKDVELEQSASQQEQALATLNKISESGHRAIPKEGQRIRALAKPRNGRLEGLYPGWFSLVEENPELGSKEPAKTKETDTLDDSSKKKGSSSSNGLTEITKEESERYYFELMQKSKDYRVQKKDAATYLRGVWRLDRKAHMSGGHYTRADQGDDVSLICTERQLVQSDFSRNKPVTNEYVVSLSKLQQDERGRLSFDKNRVFVPLSETHMMVGAYDYVVVLRRVSVRAQKKFEKQLTPER